VSAELVPVAVAAAQAYFEDAGLEARDWEAAGASRNLVAFAVRPGVGACVVKLGHGRDAAGDGALLSEGLLYLLASRLGRDDPARAHLPVCLRHDRQRDVLVLRRSAGCPLDAESADPDVLASVGRALRAVHDSLPRTSRVAQLLNPAIGPGIPWADGVDLDDLRRLGAPERAVLGAILGDDGLRDALGALARTWRSRRLIHGDLRSDNVLLDGTSPVFIDWELCRLGDPAHDLGQLASSLLRIGDDPNTAPDRVRALLGDLRAGYGAAGDPLLWHRAVAFAGASLLVQVLAHARHLDGLAAGDAQLLATGSTLLKRPAVGPTDAAVAA
jgi:hypothetical protein